MTAFKSASALLLAVGLALLVAGCGGAPSVSPAPGSSSLSPSSGAGAPATPTAVRSAAASGRAVQLFFSANGKLVPEPASVTATDPQKAALEALLAGPKAAGHVSDIPKGVQLLNFQVSNGTAQVSLSKEFFVSGGSLGTQLRLAEVVYTLTQFPDIQNVQILQEGQVVPVLGGEGFPINRPLTRQQFATLA